VSARLVSVASLALAFGTAAALCVAGGTEVARGLAVPVRANLAQHRLEARFDAALAQGRSASAAGHRARPLARPLEPDPLRSLVARLSVPRLGVREVVLAGNGSHEQLADAPVMIGRGKTGGKVTVLAAHRDTHFLFVRDLHVGDEVRLRFVDGRLERYRVLRFETVRWDEFAFPLDPARPLLALTTCYPFGGTEYGGPLRRVAWAERIA